MYAFCVDIYIHTYIHTYMYIYTHMTFLKMRNNSKEQYAPKLYIYILCIIASNNFSFTGLSNIFVKLSFISLTCVKQ